MSDETPTTPIDAEQAPDPATVAAEGKARAAEMKLAFNEAGIDYKDGLGSLLLEVYQGDADPEAIKAEAVRRGILPEGVEPPSHTPEEEQMAALRRGAGAGGATADDGSENPRDVALRVGREAMTTGRKTREDAMVDAIRVLATAGKAGDKRVLIPSSRDD